MASELRKCCHMFGRVAGRRRERLAVVLERERGVGRRHQQADQHRHPGDGQEDAPDPPQPHVDASQERDQRDSHGQNGQCHDAGHQLRGGDGSGNTVHQPVVFTSFSGRNDDTSIPSVGMSTAAPAPTARTVGMAPRHAMKGAPDRLAAGAGPAASPRGLRTAGPWSRQSWPHPLSVAARRSRPSAAARRGAAARPVPSRRRRSRLMNAWSNIWLAMTLVENSPFVITLTMS